jgi:hypothetical protein
MTPLTPAAVTALAQQAAEPPYDPSCVECRRAHQELKGGSK